MYFHTWRPGLQNTAGHCDIWCMKVKFGSIWLKFYFNPLFYMGHLGLGNWKSRPKMVKICDLFTINNVFHAHRKIRRMPVHVWVRPLQSIIHSTLCWASLCLCKSVPPKALPIKKALKAWLPWNRFCQYNGIWDTFFCVRVWCGSSAIVGLSPYVCWASPCALRKSVCLLRILTRQARMLSTNILILAPSVSSFHHGK